MESQELPTKYPMSKAPKDGSHICIVRMDPPTLCFGVYAWDKDLAMWADDDGTGIPDDEENAFWMTLRDMGAVMGPAKKEALARARWFTD
jgi:hypothetical protein